MKRSHVVSLQWIFVTGFLLCNAFVNAQSIQNNKLITGNAAVELTVVKNSDAPYSDQVHVYVLKVENKSGQPVSFQLKTDNTTCDKKISVNFDQEVYSAEQSLMESLSNVSVNTIIPAHGSMEFNVRLVRPLNTPLNSWNCTEVFAFGSDNKTISNTLIIESFIPDPKDFK